LKASPDAYLDAAGAKLVSLYNYPAEGPGVMLIFDVPEPEMAPAIAAVACAGGAIQNVKLTRLLTQDELKSIQQKGVSFAPHTSRPASSCSNNPCGEEVRSPAHPGAGLRYRNMQRGSMTAWGQARPNFDVNAMSALHSLVTKPMRRAN
jgi:hypothetical protein